MQKALLPHTDSLRKLSPSTSLFSLKGMTHIFLHYKRLNLYILPASTKNSLVRQEIKDVQKLKYVSCVNT